MISMYDPESSVSAGRLCLHLTSIVFDQSMPETQNMKSFIMRLFFTFFMFTYFNLSKGYSGALISFLTAPLLSQPINSIEEIIEASFEKYFEKKCPFSLVSETKLPR